MNKKNHSLYNRWKNIIERCNNPKNKNYKYYGGKGIVVDERWHDFWNFVEDVDFHILNGHLLYLKGEYHLDKDIKGGRIYSLENCVVVPAKFNMDMTRHSRKIIALKDDNKTVFHSISEASRTLNMKRTNIMYGLRSGKPNKSTGYSFKYYE
ncbi:hypothetical protein [Alkalihalobacillus sp. R86527]|uniref:hypothetical protein n=1 Tax=Alkalihalobacillus sp. R86527 TaxID=3093863 RepID=UPI003671DC0A